jgi:hypothetical protein
MRQVPVGMTIRSDTFIDLEYVHAWPRNGFVGKSTKHHPWRVPSTDSHDEAAAGSNRPARLGRDQRRRLPGNCIGVGKHFNSHFCPSLRAFVSLCSMRTS